MSIQMIILLSLLGVTLAADIPIPIIEHTQDIQPDGSFSVSWESGNGITYKEHGIIKNTGRKDAEAAEVTGSASWTAPDGTKINLNWLADENGANFKGAHLPTPPPTQPIPILIERALKWIAANPDKEDRNRV